MKELSKMTSDAENISPRARRVTVLFVWLTRLFAIGILIQVFLAGLALFVDTAQWTSHTSFSRAFSFLPILMFAASIPARLPVSVRLRSLGLMGMIVGMFLTAILSSKIGFLSALHPVIALMLFWSTLSILKETTIIVQGSTTLYKWRKINAQ